MPDENPESLVLRLRDTGFSVLTDLFASTGLTVELVDDDKPIPGSHWGDEEAGLIRHTLYVRLDTPVHSALHEAGHWLLMSDARRSSLHTNAGGSAVEEMAVCYLQVLLSDQVPGMGQARMLLDMDRWGYSFRLGSARSWFEQDADDARLFLERSRLGISSSGQLADELTHAHSIAGL